MSELKKNAIHTLDITGYTAEGMGVGRLDGQVVFVPNTIRGERWQVQLLKVNKNVAWARGVKCELESACRVPSDCPHSGPCGGCQFRHMDYTEELEAKRQRVEDALCRVGGADISVETIHGARDTHRYRNKVQFPVAQGKEGVRVGLFRARSHDVIDVPDCLLQSERANRLGRALKQWMERERVAAYDEKTRKGIVRHLYVRTNRAGESLVCLVVNAKKIPEALGLVHALQTCDPGLVGVVLNVNQADTNVILGDSYRTLWGRDWLEEELCGQTFRLSVPSFFQINRDQTEVLYSRALDFAALTGKETVLDLYCGIGTISLTMAQKAGKVIGAEIVPEAIEDAKANAERNGVTNAEFFCGDAGEIAYKLAAEGVRPDVICVDPPRKGLAPDVPDILADMAPERIVYVSCDPATLARDVKRLAERGYVVKAAEAVDLFPRTQHVESVVCLSRKNSNDKKRAFFENTKLLSDQLGIIPLMYGSLGLEHLTGENLNADDIDILIPKIFLSERWTEFKSVLEHNGYTLIDEHGHEFEKDGVHYSYAQIEELESFAGISLSEIATIRIGEFCFKLLSLPQYLKVYTASSKDGYRVNVREKKDSDKIAFINLQLQKDAAKLLHRDG